MCSFLGCFEAAWCESIKSEFAHNDHPINKDNMTKVRDALKFASIEQYATKTLKWYVAVYKSPLYPT